jgi:hypothetical protein
MPHVRGPAAVLIAVLSIALWVAHAWRPAPATDAGGLTGADVPLVVGGAISSGDLPLPPEYKSELPGARIVSRSYCTRSDAVQFLLLSGNAEAALHDPRQCMGGWHLSDPGTASIPGTPIVAQTFEGAETGDVPDVQIAYFYVVDGHFISNPSQIRLSILGNAFLGRRSAPVYFFRFIQPLAADPAQNSRQEARLLAFASQMWQAMRPRISPNGSPR